MHVDPLDEQHPAWSETSSDVMVVESAVGEPGATTAEVDDIEARVRVRERLGAVMDFVDHVGRCEAVCVGWGGGGN